ncbi:MAG TPA: SOS response-associated peptidase [Bacteroidia bacterium]|jgi:putative SOS response-associated peptidase YedK|nr:SOS response-associated peptidase [Bacteroidia bacterium]
MCYNIAATDRVRELLDEKVKDIFALNQLYHVSGFAHPDLPVVIEDIERRFELMHWGLIPSWTKSEEQAIEFSNMSLNAKAETIFEKPMFRQSILTKRCVLPVDGFYEWRDIARVKYPYYIFPKDMSLFYFGCIYDTWTNMNTGEIINSFSIVTTEANETMAMIHNSKKRMPLILDEKGWQQWIDPKSTKEQIQVLLKPSPNEILSYHTISKDISHKNVDCNYPEIQNEVMYPEMRMQLEF